MAHVNWNNPQTGERAQFVADVIKESLFDYAFDSKAIMKAKQDGFRNNPAKENRIKRALYQITNDDDEVERIYRIVVEQEEY